MKLTVHKLGRITDAELDIRPLTVFSGHNGTNKTWLAWALFELLRSMSTGPNVGGFRMESGLANPLSERIRNELKPLFDALGQDNSTAVVSINLDELDVRPNGKHVSELDREQLTILLGANSNVSDESYVRVSSHVDDFSSRKTLLTIEIEPGLGRLTISSFWTDIQGMRIVKATAVRPNWEEAAIAEIVLAFTQQFFLTVLCLPADRAGLLLAAESGEPEFALPSPLNDFLKVMRLMRTTRRESTLRDELLPLLSRIAGGEVRLAGAKGEERLVLDVSGREIPIAVASSLSRSMAGLVQYIRAFASPGDVLFIDELEMNAHPKAQLALVELMAVMVSHGIRIVFTTHSPYVIDHLNNLLEAGRAPEDRQEKLAEEFQLRTRRAFLPADKVSVYAFEETPDGSEVKVTNAIDPKSGLVTKSTFAPVTQKLSQLFNAALDASEDNA